MPPSGRGAVEGGRIWSSGSGAHSILSLADAPCKVRRELSRSLSDGMTGPSSWKSPETMAIPTQLVLPFGPGASASSRCGGDEEGTVRCQGGELPPSRPAWSQLSLLGGCHVLGHSAASASWKFQETRNRPSTPVRPGQFSTSPVSVYKYFQTHCPSSRPPPVMAPPAHSPSFQGSSTWGAGAEASHHGWSTHPLPRPPQAHHAPARARTRRSIG